MDNKQLESTELMVVAQAEFQTEIAVGISERGFMVMLLLRSQDGRLAMLIGFCDSRIIMVLPV